MTELEVQLLVLAALVVAYCVGHYHGWKEKTLSRGDGSTFSGGSGLPRRRTGDK